MPPTGGGLTTEILASRLDASRLLALRHAVSVAAQPARKRRSHPGRWCRSAGAL